MHEPSLDSSRVFHSPFSCALTTKFQAQFIQLFTLCISRDTYVINVCCKTCSGTFAPKGVLYPP